jgi:hypothetical protein
MSRAQSGVGQRVLIPSLLSLSFTVWKHMVRIPRCDSEAKRELSSDASLSSVSYANSVLQSLYFSKPFRELVEAYVRPGASIFSPPSVPGSPLSNRPSTISSTSSRPKSAGPTAPSTSSKKPPSRGGIPPGGGRSGMSGGHKRQASVPGSETSDSPAAPNSTTSGAPLTQTTTQTSFTGVGTPLLSNGALASETPLAESTLLTTLHDLFVAISSQPKTTGTVAPQAFINQLKRDNEFFRSTLHQDAHEFLNYLVNMIAEALEKEEKDRAARGAPSESEWAGDGDEKERG